MIAVALYAEAFVGFDDGLITGVLGRKRQVVPIVRPGLVGHPPPLGSKVKRSAMVASSLTNSPLRPSRAFELLFVVSTTSVLPSQSPLKSPFQSLTFAGRCGLPSR